MPPTVSTNDVRNNLFRALTLTIFTPHDAKPVDVHYFSVRQGKVN